MPDAGPLTLLHISDMQFGKNHQFRRDPTVPANDLDNLLQRLRDDLDERRAEDDLTPDLLICTGDLAEWGFPTEFSEATHFLGELAKHLKLDRSRVVIIPGNHDVNRNACRRHFEQCEERGQPHAPPWFPKWQDYADAFQAFYQTVPDVTFPVDQPWSLFRCEDLKVVVAGLNSTLAENHRDAKPGEDGFSHYGWCGERQLRDFSRRLSAPEFRGWLRIGAVHHNWQRGCRHDAENLNDADDFVNILGPHLHLVLHGHTHRADTGKIGDQLPFLAAGSAGLNVKARPDDIPNQYQLVELQSDLIRVHSRVYLPDRKRWAADPRCKTGRQSGRKEIPHAWRGVDLVFSTPSTEPPIRYKRTPAIYPLGANFSDPESGRESFLSRVAECYEFRHPGARVEIRRPAPSALAYLHVAHQQDAIVQQFPVGASTECPDAALLNRFAAEVAAPYRAADPANLARFVHGGSRAPDAALRRHAQRLNVTLQSFVECQGLVDFSDYLKVQNERLAKDKTYPASLYVTQRMEFETAGAREETDDALARVLGWLSEGQPRFILLLGDFGTGKTFLLREVARRLGRQPGAPVPLLIELRSLEKAVQVDQLLVQHLSSRGFERFDLRALRYMLHTGRAVLLFDGFDELALRVGYAQAADHLAVLMQAAQGEARIIVSSRTSHFENDQQVRLKLGTAVQPLQGLRYCRLHRFDADQIKVFLGKRFPKTDEARRWFELLHDVKDLLGLGENPRMLSFICELKRERLEEVHAQSGEITAAELYRLLIVEHWFGYELPRRYPSGVPKLLTAPQWLDPAQALALALWTRADRWLTRQEMLGAVNAALERYAPERLSQSDEAVQAFGSGTLFVPDDAGRHTFVHQSVMEWLVARRVAADLDREGHSLFLETTKLSALMTDFLLDLSLRPCVAWRESVLNSRRASGLEATGNALLILNRHEARLEASIQRGGKDARRRAEAERHRWQVNAADFTQLALFDTSLQGQDLSGVDFANAKLRGADLTDALLSGGNFTGADLHGANLSGAICDRANFDGANLENVQADGCSALKANFQGARLAGSSWQRARLLGAYLNAEQRQGMNLTGAAVGGPERLKLRLPRANGVQSAACWSPDGARLAVGGEEGSVWLLDLTHGTVAELPGKFSQRLEVLTWSPDGSRLAGGCQIFGVCIWRPNVKTTRLPLLLAEADPVHLAWAPDGKRLWRV